MIIFYFQPSFNVSSASNASAIASKISSHRSTKSRGISPRRVLIPGIGTAIQSPCGEVHIRYPDGAQLTVDVKGNVRYEWPNGHTCNYGPTDLIPVEVREKLSEMPRVVKHLAKPTPERLSRTRSVR